MVDREAGIVDAIGVIGGIVETGPSEIIDVGLRVCHLLLLLELIYLIELIY